MCNIFALFSTFYIGFGRVIELEWGDKRDALCKVCLPNQQLADNCFAQHNLDNTTPFITSDDKK